LRAATRDDKSYFVPFIKFNVQTLKIATLAWIYPNKMVFLRCAEMGKL